jgi:nucleotide-binding universal stress UspA family protein
LRKINSYAPEQAHIGRTEKRKRRSVVLMFKNILVAVDGSDHANRAVEFGAGLAEKFESKLTLLHVMPHAGSHRIPDDLKEFARAEHLTVNEAEILSNVADAIVDRGKEQAKSCGAKNIQTAIATGDAATNIINYCKNHEVDTVVMGRRGLGDLAGLFLAASPTRSHTRPSAHV